MKAGSIVVSVWLCGIGSFGQVPPDESIDISRLTDEVLSFQDEDLDYNDIYENFVQILSSRLDLNTVTAEELKSLYILRDLQIKNFLAYREMQGPFIDIHELQVIPDFDREVIARLAPFVTVTDPAARLNASLFQRMVSAGNSYVIARYERTLEAAKGFKPPAGNNPPYVGSPDKTYFRFRSSVSGDFSIGLAGEKDAGEKIKFDPKSHQWGFDFSSYHLQVRNKGKLNNLIVGDYQSQFGQGLMMGGAFGLGKGGESVATTRKSNVGFQPYTSVHESVYQRGLALTYNPIRAIGISAFYSSVFRDGSTEGEGDSIVLTSLQTTGYHRTRGELMKRKKVREQNTGLVIHFAKDRMDAGLMVNVLGFSMPLHRKPQLYNQFVFNGAANVNTGVFFNFRFENISFFSEIAKSVPGGYGMVGGVLLNVHTDLELAILGRNYQRTFYTFYSNAFSENTQPQNERGVYWGWKYRWNRRYSLNGYVDLFLFPWLGFRRNAPSTGNEWLLRGSYRPARNISTFVQIRGEGKDLNLPGGTLYKIGERFRQNMSLNCDYESGNIRLRSRIQYTIQDFNGTTTEGWAIVQDISIALGKFQFTGRHGLFHTDENDNRQYVYESDAWSAYSLPAYTGTGVRNYALIEYKVNEQLTIWLRYARTRVTSDGEIGSGDDLIEGNMKNDVKFQARLKF